jgi:glycosyltransferase involved in cell wall biosynthesis
VVKQAGLREVAFAVPGDLKTPTGGYAYDRHIIAELAGLGWQVEVLDIGEGFPHPTADVRAAACARLAGVPDGRTVVIDGLALGVLPDAAAALGRNHTLIALVHHPLALETGLAAGEAETLRASERAALGYINRVIAVSAATARLLTADYGVPVDRITVVQPGTDRVAQHSRPDNAMVSIISVGAVVPRKGYDVLVAALAKVADLPWRLSIVGDRGRSPRTASGLDHEIARRGLADRIGFIGAVEPQHLATLYDSADLFVLASRFEGYGMAYAEAIAHGLPVVGTTAGAIPDTVPAGAGVLVPPDDVDALAGALRRLIDSKAERAALAAGARAAAAKFPSWRESAQLFAQVLDAVA